MLASANTQNYAITKQHIKTDATFYKSQTRKNRHINKTWKIMERKSILIYENFYLHLPSERMEVDGLSSPTQYTQGSIYQQLAHSRRSLNSQPKKQN